MTQKGPSSFHDLVAALSTHAAEDKSNFDGMKSAFASVEKTQKALDEKQDMQIVALNALLAQANESALERGRRIEREKIDRLAVQHEQTVSARRLKWFRYAILPIIAIVAHLLTKYLHL
jgi:uncharacterized protein (DUF488 family)